MNDFYVYQLLRPWNRVPCYIGKGRGRRAWAHARLGVKHYNTHLGAIFRKAGEDGVPIVMLHTGLTEAEAFAIEVQLIASIGRANLGTGPLANWTDGGDGVAGRSDVSRDKARLTHAAIWSPAKRAAHSAIMRASPSDRTSAWTLQLRASVSETHKAIWTADKRAEHSATIAASRTPEVRAKISAAMMGRPDSDETRTRKSEAAKRNWAKRREASREAI